MRSLLLLAATAILSWPAGAALSFLPATDAPVLLLLDSAALTPAREAQARRLGYAFDPQMLPDCSATDFELLTARLRTAPHVVAVLDSADHALVLQALRFEGFAIDHDAPVPPLAARDEPALLAPVLAVLRGGEPVPALHAVVARRR
jgi:hypothetical protein